MRNWKVTLVVLAATVTGCAIDQQLIRAALNPEAVRAQQEREQENARYLEEQAAREAKVAAEKAERKRAEEESAKQEKKEQAARKAELVNQHRANDGFMIGEVGPVCLYRPDAGTVWAASRSLTDLYLLSKCQSYSKNRAAIQVSFLNDTQKVVKDLRVKCILLAPSGTALGGYSTATIYQKWEPGEIKVFEVEAPLHPQAGGAKCSLA